MKRTAILAALAVLALGAAAAAAADQPAAPADVFHAVTAPYLVIQADLAADKTADVAASAQAIAAAAAGAADADAAALGVAADKVDEARALLPKIAAAATAMARAADLKAAREAFVPLSEAVVALRDIAVGERPVVAYCPMAKHEWLQPAGKVANPFYGSKMLRCGSIVRK